MKKLKFLFGKKGVISLYGVVVALIVCIMLCGYMDLTQTTHVVEEIQSILDITALSTLQGSLDAEGVRFDRLTLRDYTYFLPDDTEMSQAERLAINSETDSAELLEALKADSERLQDVTIWIDGTNADNVNEIAVRQILLRNFNYYLTKLLHTGSGASKQPLFDYSTFDENNIVMREYEGDSIIKKYEIREFDAGLKYWSWGVDAEDKDGNYQKVPQAYLATTIWLYLSVEPTFSALNLSIEESQIYNALDSALSTSSLHIEGYTDDGLLAVSIRTLSRMTVQGFIASDDTADIADLGVNFDAIPYTPEEYFDITDAGVVTGFSDEYYALPKEERPTNIKMPLTIRGITPVAIGDNAFDESENEDDIALMILPASITSIGKEAFLNADQMKNFGITGTSKLTSIGESAFKSCSSLLTFTCPNGVTEIPSYAFYGCSNMTSFKFSTSLEKIGTSAFENCKRLKGTLDLPDSVETIQDKAFFNCTAIFNLHVPQNLKNLGSAAFGRLSGLSTIDNKKDNPNFEVLDNVLYQKETDGTYALIVYPSQRKNTIYTIPLVEGQLVTRIADYAFYGNNNLDTLCYDSGNPDESQEMLQGIRVVGASAFELCSHIKQLQFAGDIVSDSGVLQRQGLQAIGENAFYNTSGLNLIYIDKLKDSVSGSPWGANTFQTAIRWKTEDNFDWSMMYKYNVDGTILGLSDYGASIVSADPNFQLIIPEVLHDEYWGDVQVKAIGNYAFSTNSSHILTASANRNITRPIEILAPITYIGTGAFYGSPLEYFAIPDSVTAVGDMAFANSAIEQFVINDISGRVLEFGNSAFEGCKNLEEFTVPYCLTTVGKNLFKDCVGLKRIRIDALWTEIPDYTFSGCISLNSVVCQDSVVKVGKYCFENCKTLTGLGLTTRLTHVGEYAFTGCNGIEVINFGENIVSIGEYAFLNTPKLATVKLEVEEDFVPGQPWGAASFTDIIWKNSKWVKYYTYASAPNGTWKIVGLSDLGRQVLNNKTLTNLQTPPIKDNTHVVGFSITSAEDKEALKNLTSMKIVAMKHDNGYPIAASSFEGATSMKKFEMSSVITSIGDKAFKNCSALQAISVPSSVTELGAEAFRGCVNLEEAVIGVGVTNIKDYTFYECKKLSQLGLLGQITNIGTNAFAYTSALPEFNIKDSTATIGDYAFSNSGIKQVTCDANPSLTQFNIGVFSGCASLKNLYMPKTVTTIKERAFYSCTSLQTIHNSNTSALRTIENEAFMETTSLSKLPAFPSLQTIGTKAFYATGAVTIESQPALTTIGTSAFQNSTKLTEIKVCSSLTTIKDSAFTGCTALVTLANMPSLNTIETNAFQNCFVLNDFVQSSVTTVGDRAFAFCRSLKTVTSSSLQTVGMSAFSACTSLTTIDAPNLVELKNNAFSGCTSLTSMTRSDSLTTIGSSVFVDSPMTVMHLGSSIRNIASDAFTFMESLNTLHIHRGEYQSMSISNHSSSTTTIVNSRANEPWGAVNAYVIWYNSMTVGGTTVGAGTDIDVGKLLLPTGGGVADKTLNVQYNGDVADLSFTEFTSNKIAGNSISWNGASSIVIYTTDNTHGKAGGKLADKYQRCIANIYYDIDNRLSVSDTSVSITVPVGTSAGMATAAGVQPFVGYSGAASELSVASSDSSIGYGRTSDKVLFLYAQSIGAGGGKSGTVTITITGDDCEPVTVTLSVYQSFGSWSTTGGEYVWGSTVTVMVSYSGNVQYAKVNPLGYMSSNAAQQKGWIYEITSDFTVTATDGVVSSTGPSFTWRESFTGMGGCEVTASDSYSTSGVAQAVYRGPADTTFTVSVSGGVGITGTYSAANSLISYYVPAGCPAGSYSVTVTSDGGIKLVTSLVVKAPGNR